MEPKRDIKKVDGFSTETKVRFGRIPTEGFAIPHFQPMRQRRYTMEVPLDGEVVKFFVASENPTMVVMENPYMGTFDGRHYDMGRTTWDSIQVKINDVIGNHDRSSVLNSLHGWFGDVSSGQDARTYKKNITLSILDPTGVVAERFYLIGVHPIMINISTDYGSHDVLYDIEMTLSFDQCTHNTYI